jgi:endonuclease/exonuclease/phosphatase family metal-dependent hydrolase
VEKRDGWLRVITLNTWKGDGRYRKRLDEMASQLCLLQPDILFLQEAVRSEDGFIDTAGFLASFLDLYSTYAPARRKNREIEGEQYICYSGLAILSRYEINDQKICRLPSSPEDPDRISFSAEITVNEKIILLTNLHLTHLPKADELRLRQFCAVTNSIITSKKTSTCLCGGDFNLVLTKTRMQEITENSRLQINDCYLAGGGELPGKTFANSCSRKGTGRIDYILNLVGEGMLPLPCKNSRIVLNQSDPDGILPSDHFGVMSDVFIGNL